MAFFEGMTPPASTLVGVCSALASAGMADRNRGCVAVVNSFWQDVFKRIRPVGSPLNDQMGDPMGEVCWSFRTPLQQ